MCNPCGGGLAFCQVFLRWGRYQQVAMNLKMLHHTVDGSEIRNPAPVEVGSLSVYPHDLAGVLAPSKGGDHRISEPSNRMSLATQPA